MGVIKTMFYTVLVLLYFTYFAYAMYYTRLEDEDAVRLLWVTCLVVFCVILYNIHDRWGKQIGSALRPCVTCVETHSHRISWYVTLSYAEKPCTL